MVTKLSTVGACTLLALVVLGVSASSLSKKDISESWPKNVIPSQKLMPSEVRRILRYKYGSFDQEDPEATLPTPALIEHRGYPAESHTVTTNDGYMLTLHRIPYSPKSPAAPNKPVAFLMHGLLCSSADWLVSPTEKAFGFMMADAGYDVWLGNARGNTYSTAHVSLDTKSEEYWDFSWDEMGTEDLPAVLPYVLNVTGQEDLYYVGHSMGTTMFWIAMIEYPELNSVIRAMFAFAPVAYTTHMESPLRYVTPFSNLFDAFLTDIGIYHLFSSYGPTHYLATHFCNPENEVEELLCTNILFILCGYDYSQFNVSMTEIIFGHIPAGCSVNTLMHYGQGVNSEKFCYYDFGSSKNQEKYGQDTPPDFDLSKVTAPVNLFWGPNDWLGDPSDVEQLSTEIGNLVNTYRVDYEKFNHMDFLYAIDANTLVYAQAMDLMRKF